MEVKRIEDIELLVQLRFDFLSGEVPIKEKDWVDVQKQLKIYLKKHISQQDFFALGLELNGKIVSCAFLLIDERPASLSFPNGIIGTILNVYTYPEYRCKGYAEVVMEKLLSEARERNVSVVCLSSTKAGKRLYEKLGFKISEYTDMDLKIE